MPTRLVRGISMEIRASLNSGGRFASLLNATACPRPLYDEILLETNGCVVTPTLGSVLPNWLLVIPRFPIINFAQWHAATGKSPVSVLGAILDEYGVAQDRAIWFEHGPAEGASTLGCGVDQAHLHVIVDAPFSFQEFSSRAKEGSKLAWQASSISTAYNRLDLSMSYLLMGRADQAILAQNVESVGSQFFRRVAADLAGKADLWNYRTHPHLDNVQMTIENFTRYKEELAL